MIFCTILQKNMSELFNVTYSNLSEYNVYTVNVNNFVQTEKKIRYFFVIDNSGSMGSYTQLATKVIIQGLIGNGTSNEFLKLLPSTIIEFHGSAQILSSNICSSEDLNSLSFRQQGSTNITDAIIKVSVEILKHVDDAHNFLIFLSDGQHTDGPFPESFKNYGDAIKNKNIKLSVAIVGISNCNNSVGMLIKRDLENTEMVGMENIYYATFHPEMEKVVNSLTDTIKTNLNSSVSVKIDLPDGSVFKGLIFKSLSLAAKCISNVIMINNYIYVAEKVPVSLDVINNVFEYYVPKLAKLRLVDGLPAIQNKIKELECLILAFEDIINIECSSTIDDIGIKNLSTIERLAIFRKIKGYVSETAHLRNQLQELSINLSNDSKSQAEYLNGNSRKFSAKAIKKSGVINKSFDEVISDFRMKRVTLKIAIDDEIDSINFDTVDRSFITLQSAIEHFNDWDFDLNVTSIYEMLISYTFIGVPVKFVNNNACQMDPFQTKCLLIEPYVIDSSTIYLANQVNREFRTLDGNNIDDILILVDPSCPKSSLSAMKTNLYEYHCSVSLCKDLYMYNYNMTFSIHAHGLIQCLTKVNHWSVNLALHILYSIKKFGIANKYQELFNHWWEWGGITQSEEDGCNHPAQLPILILFFCKDIDKSKCLIPYKNLISEYLSREFKKILKSTMTITTKDTAIKDLQIFFGIDKSNCPFPNEDVLISEPPLEVILEQCQKWSNIAVDSKLSGRYPDIQKFINEQLLPVTRAFELAFLVSQDDLFIQQIESRKSIPSTMYENYTTQLNKFNNIGQYLGYLKQGPEDHILEDHIPEDSQIREGIYLNLFCQSLYYHTSDDRKKLLDFEDDESLEDIIVKLRVSIYFDGCKIKKEEYDRIIGNITYKDALSSDVASFTAMINGHTHGGTKKHFWALLEASKQNVEKKEVFLSKSNKSVLTCYGKQNKKF